MKVLIYGGGSVGLGIGSCLLKSKAGLCIIARQNTVSALRKHGLVRTGIFGDFHAGPAAFDCYPSLNEIQKEDYDYILVCTKSFDSFEAAKDLCQHDFLFNKNTKIVLFQNGWGNAEMFLPFFNKKQIYNARVITGFGRPNDNEVMVTVHADAIHIGSLFGSDLSCVKQLCDFIAQGGIPCQITETIEQDLWAKMLYNCTLNSLGAILDVPYGVLAEYEFTRSIMENIAEEAFKVMVLAGYETHWPGPKGFLKVFYERLVTETANTNHPLCRTSLQKRKLKSMP